MKRKLFPGQQTGESIYIVARQHWVIFAKHFFIWALLASALALFQYYAPLLGARFLDGPISIFIDMAVQLYVLFLVTSLFIIWVLYRLNMYIVTNERVVDVNQRGLFSHHVSELNIEKIEDVTSEVNGILGHLFDYGTVYIQTAGTKERFEFEHVPNPGHITKTILELYERTTNDPALINRRNQ